VACALVSGPYSLKMFGSIEASVCVMILSVSSLLLAHIVIPVPPLLFFHFLKDWTLKTHLVILSLITVLPIYF
jgi:hypothetical protein